MKAQDSLNQMASSLEKMLDIAKDYVDEKKSKEDLECDLLGVTMIMNSIHKKCACELQEAGCDFKLMLEASRMHADAVAKVCAMSK